VYRTMTIESYVDVEKLMEDNDIPKDAEVGGRSFRPDSTTFSFYWRKKDEDEDSPGSESKKVTLTKEELENSYRLLKEEAFFVYKNEEADYWRKQYELEEYFYNVIEVPVENCGYYPLTEQQLEEIYDFIRKQSKCSDVEIPEWDPGNEILAYHEWY